MSLPKATPNRARAVPCAALDCRACEFRSLTFCDGLRDDEIGQLSSIVTRIRLDPRQMIFHEGDTADHVFNVTDGTVKLYKLLLDGRRQITGFLLPGDFLGLASRRTYSYSAEAIDEVSLCRFPRRRLEEVFDQFPHLERRLLDIADDELVAAQNQMLLLGRKTAIEKFASFLLHLSEREQRRGAPASPVQLPMTRGDIADYLGLTIETVSRTVSQLKRRNLVRQISLTEIEILDPEGLRELAEA
jgi:CRP/FNR family transcriptional regulator